MTATARPTHATCNPPLRRRRLLSQRSGDLQKSANVAPEAPDAEHDHDEERNHDWGQKTKSNRVYIGVELAVPKRDPVGNNVDQQDT